MEITALIQETMAAAILAPARLHPICLPNPVSKEQANQALADYRDSLYEADNLAETGDGVPIIAWVSGATALVALVLLGFYFMRSRKHD